MRIESLKEWKIFCLGGGAMYMICMEEYPSWNDNRLREVEALRFVDAQNAKEFAERESLNNYEIIKVY